jgi:hypothetical protein
MKNHRQLSTSSLLFSLWTGLAAASLSLGLVVRADDMPGAKGKSPEDIVAGARAEIGRYAYTYRKGASDNPWETRWLEPTEDMVYGLLWAEKPLVDYVEVEYAGPPGMLPDPKDLTVNLLSGGLYPRRVHPSEKYKETITLKGLTGAVAVTAQY